MLETKFEGMISVEAALEVAGQMQVEPQAAWWESCYLVSCRDPHLFRHDGRVWISWRLFESSRLTTRG
jgi:hypothetical protein